MKWPFQLRKDEVPRPVVKVVTIQRDFAAADLGRLFADWAGDYGITSASLQSKLPTILARTRERAKNDAYMKRYLAMCKVNIVGPKGFRLQMNVREGSGDAERPDTNANTIIERDFNRWAEEPLYVDAAGQKDFREMCYLIVNYWCRDGEAIVRLLPGFGWPDNPYAFSLKLYRPDALDRNYSEILRNGNRVSLGVEYNSWGRPVAYYFIKNFNQFQNMASQFNDGNRTRVPADEIIHFFTPEDEDQARGVPPAAVVLTALKMSDGYDEAELVAARDSACSIGVYKTQAGQDVEPSEVTADEVVQDREPGQRQVLPMGWEYDDNVPNRPNSNYPEFKKAVLRKIAAGLLVNYNTYANDLEGVNYSSLREGKLTEQDFWKMAQAAVTTHIVRRIFRHGWLPVYLTTGLSDLPLSKIEKFKADHWLGHRWPWVDPLKDARAAEIDVKHGWRTDSQVTADRGYIYENNLAIATKDAKLREGTPLEGGGSTLADLVNGYGASVRAGALTAQEADEILLRGVMNLPEMSPAVKKAWQDDGGARAPVTLQKE